MLSPDKEKVKRTYIECSDHPITLIVNFIFVAIFAIVLTVLTYKNEDNNLDNLIVVWCVIWGIVTLFLITTPRQLTLQDNGLKVKVLGKNFFIQWEDIIQVIYFRRYTLIVVKRLTIFSVIVGILSIFKPLAVISLSTSQTNYDEAINYIKLKVPSKFKNG